MEGPLNHPLHYNGVFPWHKPCILGIPHLLKPPQVRGGIFTKVQLPGHVHLVPHGQVREGARFGEFRDQSWIGFWGYL